jgi:hypothetical protein
MKENYFEIESFGSAYRIVDGRLQCTLGWIPTEEDYETMEEDELWG